MNKSIVLKVLGWILLLEGALMLLPLGVSAIYGEVSSVSAFAISAGICALFGVPLILMRAKSDMHTREGFAITALGWVVMSIMGAVPFLIQGCIKSPVDALFEIVSGFTTTGASILSDVEALPKGMLFWRSFSHWIGGMGVLVFLLMLKPLSQASSVNLMKAESPGPQVEKLVPKLRTTARILYGIYIAMTLIEIVILLIGRMPLFDAVTMTFGTAGTGGFGIRNDSAGGYTTFQQGVITVFMILFGVNFSFYFLMLQGKLKKAFLIEEVRWYFVIILTSVLLITINISDGFSSIWQALHHAAFQVGSIITTTGYSTVDFDLWPSFAKTILVSIMFIGACAGSTGGGIKVSRIVVLFKSVINEIKCYLHPHSVSKITAEGKVVANDVLRKIYIFFAAYIALFAVSVLIISLDNKDMVTNFTAVAATLNNIGPGLAGAGPARNFGGFSDLSKVVMIFDMLAGRLELFPLFILFSRKTWRKF